MAQASNATTRSEGSAGPLEHELDKRHIRRTELLCAIAGCKVVGAPSLAGHQLSCAHLDVAKVTYEASGTVSNTMA